MIIRCTYDAILKPEELKPNPANPNKHSPEQLERLGTILKYQGIRKPVIVSKRSGMVVTGHGTLAAIRALGGEQVPVSYQDFESEEQEMAHIVADNAIAAWAYLDLGEVNSMLPNMGPDFDLGFLGIKDFGLDAIETIGLPDLPSGDKPEFQQMAFILHDEQAAQVRRALDVAKDMGPFTDSPNENSNGNALARICESFLTKNGIS